MASRFYETDDFDIAAYLSATTGCAPSVFISKLNGKAIFSFRNDYWIEELVLSYASGAATVNAFRFAGALRHLLHQVRHLRERSYA